MIARSGIVFPEARCDVVQPASIHTVEALVGARALQGAEVRQVGTKLDIVEVAEAHLRREQRAATPPGQMQPWETAAQATGQRVDLGGLCVATHEAEAGDPTGTVTEHTLHHIGGQRLADIAPEVLRMAPRTATRAPREVDGQRHLVGNLLKDDVCVDVSQHFFIAWWRRNGGWLPPDAAC